MNNKMVRFMNNAEKTDSKNLLQYIKSRNNYLNQEEILFAVNLFLHPQLNHIYFNSETFEYHMWDSDGNYFTFKAIQIDDDFSLKKKK